MNWLLPVIVFAPLFGGVATLLVPERTGKWVAAAVSLAVFLLSLWLYFGLVFNGSPFGDVMNPTPTLVASTSRSTSPSAPMASACQ
jgi:NADH:ubiquinone oxidoreductase subunit 4 (subunit M)